MGKEGNIRRKEREREREKERERGRGVRDTKTEMMEI